MYLYWIHHPHHTDPRTEGYIGVTNDLYHREWRHRNNAGNPIAYHALNKGAVFEVLEEHSTVESVLAREVELRPLPDIGWNIAAGGSIPPPFTAEKGQDPEFRRKVKEGQNRRWEELRAAGWTGHKKIECQHCGTMIGSTMHKRHERTCKSNPDAYNRMNECKLDGCTNKVKLNRYAYCSTSCANKRPRSKRT